MKNKIHFLTLMALCITIFVSCQKSDEEYGSTSCGNDGKIPIGFWTYEPIDQNDNIKLYVNNQFLGNLHEAKTANGRDFAVDCDDPNIIWCHLPGDRYSIKVIDGEGDILVQATVGFSCQRGTIGIASLDKGSLGGMVEHNERPGCPKSNQISLIFEHKSGE